MSNELEGRVFYHFEKINEIPRESGREEAVSNWIAGWARGLGLEAEQDAVRNLLIKKPAAAGYETCEPILLQAHMDMVCEKTADSVHDFTRDPIGLQVEGDWIRSACGTSLGADNGIGVACAMAILEDFSLKHPPLEVAFTVEEETTFRGAEVFSADLFHSRRMINLDHADDREVVAGSCGGAGAVFTLPLQWEKEAPVGCSLCRLRVRGLKGGHSGEDIHRGRGNAIQLLIRILDELDAPVVSLTGGTNRLAIPREAEAVILTGQAEKLRQKAAGLEALLRREYGQAAPELEVSLEEVAAAEQVAPMPKEASASVRPMTREAYRKASDTVRLYPNGILAMSGIFTGVVESSNNLGMIRVQEGNLVITSEARGLYRATVEQTKNRLQALARRTGGQVEFFGEYVPWEYTEGSRLRQTAKEVYRTLSGSEMQELVLHAGLECGAFAGKKPGMDIISIGPCAQFFHSPEERLSISSTKRFYEFLTSLLAALR